MHILLPHEPYVFAADGSYPGLTGRGRLAVARRACGTSSQFTNDRIREMVTELLAVPEAERPIIIIEADEGPYPVRFARDPNGFDWATATPEELETKYGVLTAMYLPGDAPADAPDCVPRHDAHQHVPHRARPVLRRGHPAAARPELHERAWRRPYDLTDVTERLPAA